MGLQVATCFETPQGFPVSSVYIRIQQITLTLKGATATALVFFTATLSREKRAAVPLRVPAMPTSATFDAPVADCIRYEVLYAHIRRTLEARAFVCTSILEEGQVPVEYSLPVLDVSGSLMDVSGASPQSSESTQPTPPTPPQPEEPPTA